MTYEEAMECFLASNYRPITVATKSGLHYILEFDVVHILEHEHQTNDLVYGWCKGKNHLRKVNYFWFSLSSVVCVSKGA
jgi:hypothetical protein